MLRSSLYAAGALALGTAAFAQTDLSARVRPVTGPVKYAGVYHVATGTWTRAKTPTAFFGPDDLYDNTCSTAYYGAIYAGERFVDSGRNPGSDSPSPNQGACLGVDAYLVNGFQIAYCSDLPGPLSSPPGPGTDITFGIIEAYNNNCTTGPGAADHAVAVPGLPGGGPTLFACWIADIDLVGGPTFNMNSDADGVFNGSATTDNFSHTYEFTNLGASTASGPFIAGDPSLCGFGDSTYYKNSSATAGTGLGQGDIFWIDSTVVTPGCYFYGGWPANPWGGFHAQLYGDVSTCGGGSGPGTPFCFGDGTSGPCPCGNIGGTGEGCAHSMSTVGGKLAGTGTSSFSADDLVLNATQLPSQQFGIIFVGDTQVGGGAGSPLFDGRVCVGGNTVRYPVQNSGGSGLSDGAISQSNPVANSLGLISGSGQTWNFQCWFRNVPSSISSCGTGANFTNGYTVTYTP
jgi:hypothetical protein